MNQRTAWKMTAAVASALFVAVAPGYAQKSLDDYVQPGLKDLTATIRVLSKSDRELEKIGKGYVDAYSLEKQQVWAREPGAMRFEGRKGVFTIRYVTAGNRKLTEVPSLRIRKVDDISKEPSKGDSISDLGVVSRAWAGRVRSRWLRTEDRGGRALQVFEFYYPEDPKYRHTIFMDPGNKTVVEHVAHFRNARKAGFRKRIVYSEPKNVNGVWLPTRVALYNTDNRLAGEMRYESIKVNTGLADNLFNF